MKRQSNSDWEEKTRIFSALSFENCSSLVFISVDMSKSLSLSMDVRSDLISGIPLLSREIPTLHQNGNFILLIDSNSDKATWLKYEGMIFDGLSSKASHMAVISRSGPFLLTSNFELSKSKSFLSIAESGTQKTLHSLENFMSGKPHLPKHHDLMPSMLFFIQ